MMGEPDGQAVGGQRIGRGHEFPPHAEAAFAIECFAGGEIALRGRDDIAVPCTWRTRGFPTQRNAGDRDAQFEANEMERLVHRRIATRRICAQAIFCKAARDVIVRCFEHDIDTPAQIARQPFTVARQAGNDFNHALVIEYPASGAGPQNGR